MIYLDTASNQTICQCDRCNIVEATSIANGVVVEGWTTGQFWLDISLTEQKQIPLCFCTLCAPEMKAVNSIQITPMALTQLPNTTVDIETLRSRATLDKVALLVELLNREIFSLEEFQIAAAGDIPPRIAVVLDTFPETEKAIAIAKWKNDSVISRNHPVIIATGHALQLSDEDLDSIFNIKV